LKYIIILLLAKDPIYLPFDTTLGCYKQGNEAIETIATYHGPGAQQGWYTREGKLIYGFYCE
tara:strand:- start:88 stop:273 length:186 start_codon:yes stop_codon:yes gene_type:complete